MRKLLDGPEVNGGRDNQSRPGSTGANRSFRSSNSWNYDNGLPGDDVGNSGELGPDAWRFFDVLAHFHEVGLAYRRGAKSMAEVAAILEERDLSGHNRFNISCSPPTLTRQCKVARRFFGQFFGTGELAPLFNDHGPGNAIDGLTPLGERAWQLTHNLLSRGLGDENN